MRGWVGGGGNMVGVRGGVGAGRVGECERRKRKLWIGLKCGKNTRLISNTVGHIKHIKFFHSYYQFNQ